MLLRTALDTVTGDLSDTRTRYIGSRPVKLFRINMQGSEAVSNTLWFSVDVFLYKLFSVSVAVNYLLMESNHTNITCSLYKFGYGLEQD